MKRSFITAIASMVAIVVMVLGLSAITSRAQESGTDSWPKEVSGWAWSDNIGWISFNCANTSTCSTSDYKVMAAENGTLTGHAWSDSLGWISFNSGDITGCPESPCTPSVNYASGQVTGYARALTGEQGLTGAGEWGGWLALSGTNHSSPDSTGSHGVSYITSGADEGKFVGFGWGYVFGWVNFAVSIGVDGPSDVSVRVIGGSSRSCSGSFPSLGTVAGPSSYSGPSKSWIYNGSGTLGSCEWRCDIGAGFTYDATNNICVPPEDDGEDDPPITQTGCTGGVPESATICPGPQGNGKRSLLGSDGHSGEATLCSPSTDDAPRAKCEYYCSSPLVKKGLKCLTGEQYIREK
jgi:hypothetical protein